MIDNSQLGKIWVNYPPSLQTYLLTLLTKYSVCVSYQKYLKSWYKLLVELMLLVVRALNVVECCAVGVVVLLVSEY